MNDFGKTKSAIKPDKMVIDESSVWIHSNIESITEHIGDATFKGYQYDMVQYDKNEYILMMSEKNSQFETLLTDTQIALCEIYESMGV